MTDPRPTPDNRSIAELIALMPKEERRRRIAQLSSEEAERLLHDWAYWARPLDHIGVGSDFGGSPTMPSGLEDVSRYPALFAELAERGYSDDDLAKVAGRNVLRVMRDAERVSVRLRAD